MGLEGVKHRIGESPGSALACASASPARALGDTAIDCGIVGACDNAALCDGPSCPSVPCCSLSFSGGVPASRCVRPSLFPPLLTLSRRSTASSRIMSVASSPFADGSVLKAYSESWKSMLDRSERAGDDCIEDARECCKSASFHPGKGVVMDERWRADMGLPPVRPGLAPAPARAPLVPAAGDTRRAATQDLRSGPT